MYKKSCCFFVFVFCFSFFLLLLLSFFFFFFFEFELHSEQPWWFALYNRRAEKGWLVTYLRLLPHIPASFMTSLIQISRHKMVACTVVFSRLSNAFFLFLFFYKQDQKSTEKLDTVSQVLFVCFCFVFICLFACMLILLLFSFLSTRPMLLLRLVSPLTFRAVCPVVTSNAVTPSQLQRRAERQELWLSGLVRCAGCKWLRKSCMEFSSQSRLDNSTKQKQSRA